MNPLYPLTFKPILKRAIWGGRRLAQLGKQLGPECDYSESWEIADCGNDVSLVDSGLLSGVSMRDLVESRGEEIIGRPSVQFPLLVKFIDAHSNLSVQVHPRDEFASELGFTSGKTEMWVVIEAEPDSVLYMGLREGIGPAELRAAIEHGRVEDTLHRVRATPGDCCFLPAGAVHAIGKGVLLAEIQQPSDATLRLYDWDRVDAKGNPRPLQIEHAMGAIDFDLGPINLVKPSSVVGFDRLVDCPYFTVDRKRLYRCSVAIGSSSKFTVITLIKGGISVEFDGGEVDLPCGRTALLPASLGRCLVRPITDSAELLAATVRD